MGNKFYLTLLILATTSIGIRAQDKATVMQVPGVDQFSKIDLQGASVIPSGRLITPAGQFARITSKPFGLAISPDGKKAVSLHNGVISIIDLTGMDATRIPSYDRKIASPLKNGSFIGVAFAPDSKTVYLSGGDNGKLIIYDTESKTTISEISLNGTVNGLEYKDSFTSDLVLNESKNENLFERHC